MPVPTHLKYSEHHEWLDVASEPATVGVTTFAAAALGDIVYLQLPDVGTVLSAGEPCGEIESTKSVSDLYAPVDGEVVEVNQTVIADPSIVNSDAFGEGWLFRVQLSGSPQLLDAAAYQELTGDE